MKFSIAGTLSATVIFSDWISSQTLVGSKARITTLVTPRYTLPVIGVSAPTWKSGSDTR